MRFVIASVVVLAGCISSPSVSLVDSPDAAARVADTSADEGSSGSEGSNSTSATPPEPGPDSGSVQKSLCDGRCASAGGTCAGDVCTFSCTVSAPCTEDVICPSGMPCKVTCSGKEACQHEVRCLQATDCDIVCDGDNACKERVTCSGPKCEISCVNKGCSVDEVRCCASSCLFNGTPLTCP